MPVLEKRKSRPLRFRRTIVRTEPEQKQLLHELQATVRDTKKFEALPSPGGSGYVRLYTFRGKRVVIKDTRGRATEGFNYGEIRKSIKKHHTHVLDGKIAAERYRIKTPRVYGTIGNFVVMEYMPSVSYKYARDHFSHPYKGSMERAVREVQKNFDRLVATHAIPKAPQISDIMVLGNSNPEQPDQGKWYFSLPYDYQ
jgi:hypothetical protein